MLAKTDTVKVKILELLALSGDMTSGELKSFFDVPSYVEKVITNLRKEGLIKRMKVYEKNTFRLTGLGKSFLKEIMPEIYEMLLADRKTLNVVRNDRVHRERRRNLVNVLLSLHRADVKILPGEKNSLKNDSAITSADTTDKTDSVINHTPEFYTAVEIKSIIADYKTSNSSRALGVLISYGVLYIMYSTDDGELNWNKETEKNFKETTRKVLGRMLFNKPTKTYLVILSDKISTLEKIIRRYKSSGVRKIHPSADVEEMIFALRDTSKDLTLKLITKPNNNAFVLAEKLRAGIKYYPQYPFFAGGTGDDEQEFDLHTFMFDLYNVAAALDLCKTRRVRVNVFCFDYQIPYIKSLIDTQKENIALYPYDAEKGCETDCE